MKQKRPVYLDVTKYKFPNTAIVSILHRITGVVLFVFTPFFLWALDKSLTSSEQYQALLTLFDTTVMKLILLSVLASLIFHLVAGVRHILMDIGIGESHRGGRFGANMVFIISAILITAMGVRLW